MCVLRLLDVEQSAEQVEGGATRHVRVGDVADRLDEAAIRLAAAAALEQELDVLRREPRRLVEGVEPLLEVLDGRHLVRVKLQQVDQLEDAMLLVRLRGEGQLARRAGGRAAGAASQVVILHVRVESTGRTAHIGEGARLLAVVRGGGQHRTHAVRHFEEGEDDGRVYEARCLQHGAQVVLQLILPLLDELNGQRAREALRRQLRQVDLLLLADGGRSHEVLVQLVEGVVSLVDDPRDGRAAPDLDLVDRVRLLVAHRVRVGELHLQHVEVEGVGRRT